MDRDALVNARILQAAQDAKAVAAALDNLPDITAGSQQEEALRNIESNLSLIAYWTSQLLPFVVKRADSLGATGA